jgi:hypothetical protein
MTLAQICAASATKVAQARAHINAAESGQRALTAEQ